MVQEHGGKTDAEIKNLLGEDYDAFVAFKVARDKKAKVTHAKQLATSMVTEGGKYYDQYNRLNEQLDAIWEKAMGEARKEAGVAVEDEEA